MNNYPTFSEEAANSAIESAQQHHNGVVATSKNVNVNVMSGELLMLSECLSVTINDGKVCVNLPLGIGSVCLPIPIAYDGNVAEACISITTTFGIPTGVKLTISVGGKIILEKTFGL